MNPEDYIKDRVEDQIEWHNKKASKYKKRYYFMSSVSIVLSISIPFFISVCPCFASVLAVVSAIWISLISLFKHKEKWMNYRYTVERLLSEKMMYTTKAGKYKNENAYSIFVVECESILSSTVSEWQRTIENTGDK